MKLGKVLTYKDVDEARKLTGKRVVGSDVLFDAENYENLHREALEDENICLFSKVVEGNPFPFRVSNGTVYQFIREVIDDEPQYEPYDLSDNKVRDSLRGRWFRDIQEDVEAPERMVTSFECNEDGDEWCVNGIYTASTFLRDCVWIDDGTPCGRLMNMEVR